MSELAKKLRGRAKFLEPGSLDRRLMRQAAEELEAGGSGEVTASGVVEWCREHEMSLLPWQKAFLADR